MMNRPKFNSKAKFISNSEMFNALRAGSQFGPNARPLTLREAALNLYWANYGMGPDDYSFNLMLAFFELQFSENVSEFYNAYDIVFKEFNAHL